MAMYRRFSIKAPGVSVNVLLGEWLLVFFGQLSKNLLPVSDLELGQNLESIFVLIDCYRTEKFSSSHL